MARPEEQGNTAINEGEKPCPRCGGSGIQRTQTAGYRTCLQCVGQGTILLISASSSAAR